MKKIVLIFSCFLVSCSPVVRVFSVKGDEINVNGETLCVWQTYFFDRKTDTLMYRELDTLPCNVDYVTTFKIR